MARCPRPIYPSIHRHIKTLLPPNRCHKNKTIHHHHRSHSFSRWSASKQGHGSERCNEHGRGGLAWAGLDSPCPWIMRDMEEKTSLFSLSHFLSIFYFFFLPSFPPVSLSLSLSLSLSFTLSPLHALESACVCRVLFLHSPSTLILLSEEKQPQKNKHAR